MKQFVLTLVPLLVLFGAINTIQLKLQNLQVVDAATKAKFFHPFMQALCMFVGEALVGIVLLFQYIRNRNKQQSSEQTEKKPAPAYTVIFPAVMDILSTLFSYTALNMVDSSVWQISRGGNIITTALLSACFLKRVFHKGAVLGCFMAFLGITSVQLVAVLYADGGEGGESASTQLMGILLLVASIVFNSMTLIAEKWIFNRYEISPLKVVFLQGVYGLLVLVPLTIGFQYISCPWSDQKNCVSVDGQLYLQNIKQYWDQITNSTLLILLNFGLIMSIAISVPIAVTVSKLISPVSRSLADVCRTVLIWGFGIVMTLTVGVDQEEYSHMEDTRVVVNVLKGVGFVVLIVGTLMYHELIPVCARKDGKQKIQSLLQTEPQLSSESGSFASGKGA